MTPDPFAATPDDHGQGTAVLAFTLGAIAGLALAMLIAPAAGSQTRARVAAGVRRAAAPLFHPVHAAGVIRRSGVRGLLDRLVEEVAARRAATAATGAVIT